MALQTISVGVDESDAATGALAWAVEFARLSNATIQAVHVWETPFACTYPGAVPSAEEASAHARAVVRRALDAVGPGGRVETLVVHGNPGPSLAAEAKGADLIVVGCTGHGCDRSKPELGEILFGSTARYAVHHAAKPVAAIPVGAVWVPDPVVVVGIDGSQNSIEALRWAHNNLPARAELHAVRAVEHPDGLADYELLDPMVGAYRSDLTARVSEAAAACGDQARTVTSHVVLGSAMDALVEPGFRPDIVVVGQHGQTAATPEALGSVSEFTLRSSSVPVIVVPSQQT